mgnify:CR=1 FL=1
MLLKYNLMNKMLGSKFFAILSKILAEQFFTPLFSACVGHKMYVTTQVHLIYTYEICYGR